MGHLSQKEQKVSETGNRTPVSRVTGGDTSHYTISDLLVKARELGVLCCNARKSMQALRTR
eukprot:scaffold4982_cov92-Skeletonema_dohrnii-CCMP3373.AAC.9